MSARIMVVDDDEDIRDVLAMVLREEGYETVPASNGSEAWDLLESGIVPDLAVIDLMMPVLSGWQLVKQIRERPDFSPVRLLVITGAQAGNLPKEVRIMQKPLHLDTFIALVGELCARRVGQTAPSRETVLDLAKMSIKLRELQELKDELTALIVHDIKGPLGAVITNLDYVIEAPDASDRDEAIEDARAASHRVLRLVSNLLDLNALEDGRLEMKRSVVSVGELLMPIVQARRTLANSRGVTLTLQAQERAVATLDADLVGRAVENLVDNALKHTTRGGEVLVEAVSTDAGVTLLVGNTGSAIPSEDRSTIFEKYRQLGKSDGGRSGGLGLYFCKMVAEAHGGTVRVEERAGYPTTFVMTLPNATE